MADEARWALEHLINLLDGDADAARAADILCAGSCAQRAFELSADDIMARTGINRRAAEAIDLVDELCRYSMVEQQGENPVLKDRTAAESYFSAYLWGRHVEHFCMACLDANGRLIRTVLLSRGDVHTSAVHMREIAKAALATNAAYAILAHNHPGGSLLPSREDIEVTGRAKKTLEVLGTHLLEHYIVTSNGCTAIMQDGSARKE